MFRQLISYELQIKLPYRFVEHKCIIKTWIYCLKPHNAHLLVSEAQILQCYLICLSTI